MTISLLIDGYNLLHATGAVSRGGGPTGLARARDRMLSQIAAHFSEQERLGVQVVFDASRSRTGDTEVVVRGMTVTYAVGFDEADDLLEQLIRQHPNPRRLTVVSSDLRVQRSAKSRKATAIGSDQWLMQLLDKSPAKAATPAALETAIDGEDEPPADLKLSAEEVQRWLKEFGM